MTTNPLPRYVTSALIEEHAGSVTATWGLGELIPGGVEYFGYGIEYYSADGHGGKEYRVRFHEKATAHVSDVSSGTHANYDAASIIVSDDRVTVFFADASIGVDVIGTIRAYSRVNGEDVQTGLPVTLLR